MAPAPRSRLDAAEHADEQAEPDEWGPVVAGGRPRRRRGRRVLRLLLGLLVLVLGWGLALAWHANSSMGRVEVSGLSTQAGGRMNVLVVGSDSRADLTAEERNELTTGSAEGERTDTIMLLSVRGTSASLLAFPRDLWVTRCDGSTGRINAALAHGGPGCLVDTVEQLSDIPVHHWVEVDFGGFRDLVDAVGGVRLCLDEPIRDPKAGIDLPEGCQVLQGTDALGYVRTRQLDDDLHRIERQQEFLGALARRIASPATLVNPVRTWQAAGAGGAALRVDHGLGMVELARLGLGGRALAGDLAAATVPGTPTTRGGAWVLDPDMAAAEELFAPLRGSGDTEDWADADEVPARDEVSVSVLNGTDVDGLAGRVTAALDDLGYQTFEVDNGPETSTTTIHHAPGHRADALRLAADLPLSVAIEEATQVGPLRLPDNGRLVLLAGTDLDAEMIGTAEDTSGP